MLHRPETYPKLTVLCWVKPNDAILPVRAAFKESGASDAGRFTMALAPRYSDEPLSDGNCRPANADLTRENIVSS